MPRAWKRRQAPDREPGSDLEASLTQESMTFTFPLPPSVNHQYATVNGRRVLSAKGRTFKRTVAEQVLVAMTRVPGKEQWLRRFRSAFLGLTVRFHFPSLLRRDVDGGLKITQDALCEALRINDNRILHIRLIKALDPQRPRMEVSLVQADATSAGPAAGPVPPPA